ncbi:zinc finger CCCH domain-containing protein 19 [Rhodamnia argentea]|uniref:Zinc finger CCCH domain-containing protein 19 n=1 Tax=Rhodamnia argentea TaxID=178133 RepID=A0A8B8PCW7_9MYRT|nr:zinc finger CCCH domain-containing protein 19 [Rhodamnia argentea]
MEAEEEDPSRGVTVTESGDARRELGFAEAQCEGEPARLPTVGESASGLGTEPRESPRSGEEIDGDSVRVREAVEGASRREQSEMEPESALPVMAGDDGEPVSGTGRGDCAVVDNQSVSVAEMPIATELDPSLPGSPPPQSANDGGYAFGGEETGAKVANTEISQLEKGAVESPPPQSRNGGGDAIGGEETGAKVTKAEFSQLERGAEQSEGIRAAVSAVDVVQDGAEAENKMDEGLAEAGENRAAAGGAGMSDVEEKKVMAGNDVVVENREVSDGQGIPATEVEEMCSVRGDDVLEVAQQVKGEVSGVMAFNRVAEDDAGVVAAEDGRVAGDMQEGLATEVEEMRCEQADDVLVVAQQVKGAEDGKEMEEVDNVVAFNEVAEYDAGVVEVEDMKVAEDKQEGDAFGNEKPMEDTEIGAKELEEIEAEQGADVGRAPEEDTGRDAIMETMDKEVAQEEETQALEDIDEDMGMARAMEVIAPVDNTDGIAVVEKDMMVDDAVVGTAVVSLVDTEERETLEITDVAEGVVLVGDPVEKVEFSDVAEHIELEDQEMDDVAGDTEAVDEMEVHEDTDVAEETDVLDEMEKVDETNRIGGQKRKRGRISKGVKAPTRKKMEEDVCFICFDGGELVLCDRRGCPKVYHPSCVNRDEAFFRTKGRWNCGWHLCSNCEKNAYYMCYTCTFSLCKGCIRDAVILCVRGNKGFCETCMRTVMMIESNEQGSKDVGQVDFDDKSSWEYLFKDYYTSLKERLSLTLEELSRAKNPWKGSDVTSGKQESPDELYDANDDGGSGSDNSSGNAEVTVSKRRKAKKQSKSRNKEKYLLTRSTQVSREDPSANDSVEWASKELLEFVMHMRNGDRSVLSQFDVQALLLEYIKSNKLRDPRRKSQIICDSRLQNLFGKPRVGHFEMLRLLESHFLMKEDTDDLQGSVVDTDASQIDVNGNSDASIKAVKEKRRKKRKKNDERGLQSNLDDFAAIDTHNVNLIYLRRNLVEELIEDVGTFHDKVVGSFVRIRISGSNQKQDLYRLVPIIGTTKAPEPYKVGKKMTDYLLEIYNLNKSEVISVDIISNQDFTEDECKRLRQSIKCGLIDRLTVGDIQEKAIALQAVRVKDWLEAEVLRLSHLRDRASEKGHRKELRECVEKLQVLKTPEERQRRLEEVPEIHSDPKMDPSYESDDDEGEADQRRQESYAGARGSGLSGRGRDPISPQKGGSAPTDSWSGARAYTNTGRELTRNFSNKGTLIRGDDATEAGETVNQSVWNQTRERETQQFSSWEKSKFSPTSEISAVVSNPGVLPESIQRVVHENPGVSHVVNTPQAPPKVNETEKTWHYQDPSGKVQGPFSMVQLRKWNNTGYFPANLKIWRATEKQDDSILLTDALSGKFLKDPPEGGFPKAQMVQSPHMSSQFSNKAQGAPSQQATELLVGKQSNLDQNRGTQGSEGGRSIGRGTASSVEIPKLSASEWGSGMNLPSPTPGQNATPSKKGQADESKWSPTGSILSANIIPGSGVTQPSTNVVPSSSQVMQSSSSSFAGSGSMNGPDGSHDVATVPRPETDMLLSSGSASQVHPQSTASGHLQLPADFANSSGSTGNDMISNVATIQNLVQVMRSHNLPVNSHGWGSAPVSKTDIVGSSPRSNSDAQVWGNSLSQKSEPSGMSTQSSVQSQPSVHGQWGEAASSVQNSASFAMGNPSGAFANPWRPAGSGDQSNLQSTGPPNMNWGANTSTYTTVPVVGPENQNAGWVQMPGNPSVGWGGQVSGNTNVNWVAPGNLNPGWSVPGQIQASGVPNSGWVPTGQGFVQGNSNPGPAVILGRGAPPQNANTGWVAPGNQGTWGNEQNQHGDRFSGKRDRGPGGRDSGHSGGRSWNRQSSFGSGSGGGGGGGSSRPFFRGEQGVCRWYHESGHCKKGASCNYRH